MHTVEDNNKVRDNQERTQHRPSCANQHRPPATPEFWEVKLHFYLKDGCFFVASNITASEEVFYGNLKQ